MHHKRHDGRITGLRFVVDGEDIALTGVLFNFFALVAHCNKFGHRAQGAVAHISRRI